MADLFDDPSQFETYCASAEHEERNSSDLAFIYALEWTLCGKNSNLTLIFI